MISMAGKDHLWTDSSGEELNGVDHRRNNERKIIYQKTYDNDTPMLSVETIFF